MNKRISLAALAASLLVGGAAVAQQAPSSPAGKQCFALIGREGGTMPGSVLMDFSSRDVHLYWADGATVWKKMSLGELKFGDAKGQMKDERGHSVSFDHDGMSFSNGQGPNYVDIVIAPDGVLTGSLSTLRGKFPVNGKCG